MVVTTHRSRSNSEVELLCISITHLCVLYDVYIYIVSIKHSYVKKGFGDKPQNCVFNLRTKHVLCVWLLKWKYIIYTAYTWEYIIFFIVKGDCDVVAQIRRASLPGMRVRSVHIQHITWIRHTHLPSNLDRIFEHNTTRRSY